MRFMRQALSRIKKREDHGFTLTEILVAVVLTAIIAGIALAVTVSTKNSGAQITASGSVQEQLNNSTSIISAAVSNGIVTRAEQNILEVKQGDEHSLFIFYDPDNPVMELNQEWRSVLPAKHVDPKTPSLIQYFMKDGDPDYVIRILAENLVPDQSETGLGVFTFYNHKNQVLLNSDDAQNNVRRVALRIVAAPVDHNTKTQELSTSMSVNKNKTGEVTYDESHTPTPAPPTIYGTLPARQQTATLTWGAVAYAETYYVYRDGNLVATLTPEQELTWIEPRPWGETVTYRVDVEGGGAIASSNTVTLRVTPERPVFLNVDSLAQCEGHTVARDLNNCLTWTPRDGAEGYRVYQNNTLIYDGTQTSVRHAAVNPTTTEPGATTIAPTYGDVKNYIVVAYNTVLPADQHRGASGGIGLSSTNQTLISPPVAPTLINVGAPEQNGGRTFEFDGYPANTLKARIERTAPTTRTWNSTNLNAFAFNDVENTGRQRDYTYDTQAGNDAGWGPKTTVTITPTLAPPVLQGEDYATHPLTRDGHNRVFWDAVPNAVEYEYRVGTGAATVVSARDFTPSAAYGSNTNYYARACNVSTCSDWDEILLRQGPGPFNITNYTQVKRSGADRTGGSQTQSLVAQRVEVRWSASTAATGYTTRVAHESGTRTLVANFANRVTADVGVIPGHVYDYNVTATSANGLTRRNTTGSGNFQTSPAAPLGFQHQFETAGDANRNAYLTRSAYQGFDNSVTTVVGRADNYALRGYGVRRTSINAANSLNGISNWSGWLGKRWVNTSHQWTKHNAGKTNSYAVGDGIMVRTYKAIMAGNSAGTVVQAGRTYDPKDTNIDNFIKTDLAFVGAGYSWIYYHQIMTSLSTPWNYSGGYATNTWALVQKTPANYPNSSSNMHPKATWSHNWMAAK